MKLVFNRPNYRQLIAGADILVPLNNGALVPGINFDNAATTPPLLHVLKKVMEFAPMYSSVHRGAGHKSVFTSEFYERARTQVLNFVKGDPVHDSVIFVKNTTEAINKLAYRLSEDRSQPIVISTAMEHHSNDLPWRGKFQVKYVEVDQDGRLSLDDLERKLIQYKGNVKLVTVTGASNVTGYVNPVHQIAELAHRYQAKILVDGAQLIPHLAFDKKPHGHPMHIDFLAFSAHKMYAPFGTGVLIGPKATFRQGSPEYTGGGTVRIVTHDYVVWEDVPSKDEAGSPNVLGVVALCAAIEALSNLNFRNLERHEQSLTEYALKKIRRIPNLDLYSDSRSTQKIGVVPFNIRGLHHETVAELLASEGGIAVRSGCFCAQPYVMRLLKLTAEDTSKYVRHPSLPRPGLVRMSFGLYNTHQEIDTAVNLLSQIAQNPHFFVRKLQANASNYSS